MLINGILTLASLWELWDAPKEGPSMNSRNHIMYGSVGAWFYKVRACELMRLLICTDTRWYWPDGR